MTNLYFFFPFKSEGTRDIIPLGTIPLATIEKFNKMVSSLGLYLYSSSKLLYCGRLLARSKEFDGVELVLFIIDLAESI